MVKAKIKRNNGQDRGDDKAFIKRTHNAGTLTQFNKIGANDRGDDTHRADNQRQHHYNFSAGFYIKSG